MTSITKLIPNNAADDPNNVLELAFGSYQDVLVIGWDQDGELDVRSSSGLTDGGDLLWLLETVKQKLMNGEFSNCETGQ